MPAPWSTGSSTAPSPGPQKMRSSRLRRFRMQLLLPLEGLAEPAPMVWERLAPGERSETVAVLAS
jgi:hypothetical protein